MQTATTVAQTALRFTGLIQIVLGTLFWTGRARGMIPVHMLLGFVLVLALWALAFLAARAGVDPILVALAVLWGLVVPVLGLTQERLLPGDGHWLIQVLHLVVGLAAIGLGEGLATRITQTRPPALPA
jgi:hypothetical protein